MSPERKKISKSESTYRRRVLAEERSEPPSTDYFGQKIQSEQDAKTRLDAVKKDLSNKDDLSLRERAELTLEQIWLEFRIGVIDQAERQSRMQKYLNRLEQENHNVHSILFTEGADGLTPLAKIRNKVMPPTQVGGYHTKRRR